MNEDKFQSTSSKGLATQEDSNKSVSKAGFDNEAASSKNPQGDEASKEASRKSGDKNSKGENGEGEKSGNKSDAIKKTRKAAEVGAQAGDAGVKAFNLFTTLNFLKNMVSMATSALSNLWGAIVQAVASWVSNAVATVAAAVGTTFTTAATGLAAVGSFLVGGVAYIGAAFIGGGGSNGVRDDNGHDCGDAVKAATSSIKLDATDFNVAQEAVARQVYSVFKEVGYTNAHVAGVLGNAMAESKLDPTTIEGVYGEPFQVGPKTQAAYNNMKDHFYNVLQPAYAKLGVSLDVATYQNGGDWSVGVGLFQMTGTREKQMGKFAKANNLDVFDLKAQLAFALGPDKGAVNKKNDPEWVVNFGKKYPVSSPEEAAGEWAWNYEGNRVMAQSERARQAAGWFVKLNEMKVDANYANSVLELARTAKSAAGDNGAGSALHNCYSAQNYDNSSIAAAALSYAWHKQEDSILNDGTPLYQSLISKIFDGDEYWQSCDRSVATGVRWAGADDDFPKGATDTQATYLRSSDKWEKVQDWNPSITSWEEANKILKPGDVMVNSGQHIFFWIGKEFIEEKFKAKGEPTVGSDGLPYTIVHGSIGAPPRAKNSAGHYESHASFPSRSPGVDSYPGKTGSGFVYMYEAYRNKHKEANSKYANLEGGSNPSSNGGSTEDSLKGKDGFKAA